MIFLMNQRRQNEFVMSTKTTMLNPQTAQHEVREVLTNAPAAAEVMP